jgi:hypothetical protein
VSRAAALHASSPASPSTRQGTAPVHTSQKTPDKQSCIMRTRPLLATQAYALKHSVTTATNNKAVSAHLTVCLSRVQPCRKLLCVSIGCARGPHPPHLRQHPPQPRKVQPSCIIHRRPLTDKTGTLLTLLCCSRRHQAPLIRPRGSSSRGGPRRRYCCCCCCSCL